MAVDIFVDNALLTAQSAFIYAAFNKLPVQKAKIIPLKINDLQSHQLSQEKNPQNFLSADFVHNLQLNRHGQAGAGHAKFRGGNVPHRCARQAALNAAVT